MVDIYFLLLLPRMRSRIGQTCLKIYQVCAGDYHYKLLKNGSHQQAVNEGVR